MQDKVRNYDAPCYAPFSGDEHALSFLYAAPGLGGAPGVYTIKLELVEAEGCANGRDLYLQTSRDVVSDNREAPVRYAVRAAAADPVHRDTVLHLSGAITPAPARRRGSRAGWIEPQLPGVVRLRSISADGVERALLTQDILLTDH